MILVKSLLIRIREDEELKAPRHASAAATRDGNLPSRDGSLPYVIATCLIPNTYTSSINLIILKKGNKPLPSYNIILLY